MSWVIIRAIVDSTDNKILVITCLLFVSLIDSWAYHFADIQDNRSQSKTLTATTQQFISKSDKEILESIGSHDVIEITPALRASTGMTRRLIVAINRFNDATKVFSVALIVLAIAQFIATIYRR